MSSLWTIAGHELRRLFVSPLAWTLLAVTQLLTGLLFAMTLSNIALNPDRLDPYNGVSAIVGAGVFRFATIIMVLVVPLLTMRTFAEERKLGTLALLQTAPLSLTALVVGKFAGIMAFLTLALALVATMPLSLALGTPLDLGLIGAGLLGLWLLVAAFTATGVFISTLTREPTLAAVATLGLLLALWLLQAVATMAWQPIVLGTPLPLADVARSLSLLGHYERLLQGLFSSTDVAYFVIFSGLFLAFAVQRLDMERQ